MDKIPFQISYHSHQKMYTLVSTDIMYWLCSCPIYKSCVWIKITHGQHTISVLWLWTDIGGIWDHDLPFTGCCNILHIDSNVTFFYFHFDHNLYRGAKKMAVSITRTFWPMSIVCRQLQTEFYICFQALLTLFQARRHEQIHGAERIRPYKCSTCTKAFFTR